MITIKHLQILKEVARVKSMSKAAQNLYISQPTVSQKIQEIENYYNVKVFQRYSKTLVITPEGELILNYANKILGELNDLDNEFFNKKDEIDIRMGATLTVGVTILPQLLNQLREVNDHIQIKAIVDNTQYIEKMILENKLDIALVEGDIHNDHIMVMPTIPDQIVFVVNQDHPLAQYDHVTISQLSQYSFIVREKGSGTRAKFDQFMARYKISYHTSWVCHSWESIKQGLLNNYGITLISIHLIEKEIDEGLVKVLNVDNWNCNRMFSICYLKNMPLNSGLTTIIEQTQTLASCPINQYFKKKDST